MLKRHTNRIIGRNRICIEKVNGVMRWAITNDLHCTTSDVLCLLAKLKLSNQSNEQMQVLQPVQ